MNAIAPGKFWVQHIYRGFGITAMDDGGRRGRHGASAGASHHFRDECREQAVRLAGLFVVVGDLAWIEPLIERWLKRITEPYQAD